MLRDRDSLTCDFAEYYHLPEWEGLPVSKLAVLAAGLPPYARAKKALTGQEFPTETLMIAMLIDSVNTVAWMMTEDGAKGRNRPKSVYQLLAGQEEEKEITAYLSGDEFEAARNEILRRGGFIE